MTTKRIALLLCALAPAAALCANATEDPALANAPSFPLPWMQPLVDRLQETAAAAHSEAPLHTVHDLRSNDSAPNLVQLQLEVTEIKESLQQLQETLDLLVNRIMADLEEENAQLRREIQRLYALHAGAAPGEAPAWTGVPRPNAELLEDVLANPLPEPAPEGEEPAEFSFNVLSEWGRSPAQAEELGENASSLKGIVGVVPAGSERADLEQLGRDLRAQHAHYDNINIEVFDDIEAAQAYAEQNVTQPAHRVLSVSKHTASGRDVILLFQDGAPTELEF